MLIEEVVGGDMLEDIFATKVSLKLLKMENYRACVSYC